MSPQENTPSDSLTPRIRVNGAWIMRCSNLRAPIWMGVNRDVSARGLKPAGESLEGMLDESSRDL
jgi:hypothetical protein